MKRDEATKLNSGTLAMLLIIAVAVAAAALSWWFRARATSRALALWGAERVQLIQTGPRVSLALISSDVSSEVDLSEIDLQNVAWQDISHARGLIHLRQALVEDRSFAWNKNKPAPADGPVNGATNDWRYVLRFGDGHAHLTLVFSDAGDAMLIPADGRWVSTEPIASGLVAFFSEQLAEPTTDE